MDCGEEVRGTDEVGQCDEGEERLCGCCVSGRWMAEGVVEGRVRTTKIMNAPSPAPPWSSVTNTAAEIKTASDNTPWKIRNGLIQLNPILVCFFGSGLEGTRRERCLFLISCGPSQHHSSCSSGHRRPR